MLQDFANTSQIQKILRETIKKYKLKLKFKCGWCEDIKLSINGYANHLKICEKNVSIR